MPAKIADSFSLNKTQDPSSTSDITTDEKVGEKQTFPPASFTQSASSDLNSEQNISGNLLENKQTESDVTQTTTQFQTTPSLSGDSPSVSVPPFNQPTVLQQEDTGQKLNEQVIVTDETGMGKSKRRFSKIYLLVFILIIFLGILGFLVWKYLPKGFLGIGKGGEITWWGLWEEESIVQPLIDEYQNANPKVKITYLKQSPQDYQERLTNSLARGEGPDIFRYHNTWVPMLRSELDPIPSSIISTEEFAKIYYPIITSDLTSGSGLVGLPLGYDALTLFINEDIFSTYGKNPPQTWDDFRNLAKELTILDEKKEIQISGTALGYTENVDHWPEIIALMMLQNQVDLSKPKGQLTEDALGFFRSFGVVDKIWNNTLPPSTISFANGKVAMYFAPSWRAFEIKSINPNLRFKTVQLPQIPKETPSQANVSYATYWVEGVWTRSVNKDEAWKFLKFLSTKENLEKLYQNASKTRSFGEPYPRTDMADLLKDHPIVGSIINLAPEAKSWYLASRTSDGQAGINTQINKYFEDVVNSMGNARVAPAKLDTLTNGITQVLSQYSLIKR